MLGSNISRKVELKMHIQSPLNNGNNANSLIMRCPALRLFIAASKISGKIYIFELYKKKSCYNDKIRYNRLKDWWYYTISIVWIYCFETLYKSNDHFDVQSSIMWKNQGHSKTKFLIRHNVRFKLFLIKANNDK